MAKISVIRHGDSYRIKLRGRFAAADLGRLERACGEALQQKPAPLQLNLEAVTSIDNVARGYLDRCARGVLTFKATAQRPRSAVRPRGLADERRRDRGTDAGRRKRGYT